MVDVIALLEQLQNATDYGADRRYWKLRSEAASGAIGRFGQNCGHIIHFVLNQHSATQPVNSDEPTRQRVSGRCGTFSDE